MNIAVYGGSFDCPHFGHLSACLYALTSEPVDRLLVVPTYQHAWGKQLTAFEHRLEMTKRTMAYLNNERVEVSDMERVHGGMSLTINTVRGIAETYPGATLSWIIGADLMKDIEKWDDIDIIRKLARFLIVGRGGYDGGDGIVMPPVSSSEVRRRVKAGEPYKHLVAHSVYEYIEENGLYR